MRLLWLGLLFGILFTVAITIGGHFESHIISGLLVVLSLTILDVVKIILENRE
jgi:hypothetical protein